MFGIDRFPPSFLGSRLRGAIFGLALGLGVPVLVAAAPPPSLGGGGGGAGPEEEACAGRSVGDACTLPNRQLGTCGAGTCSRLDYSGGSPPKAVEEACVVCKPGGAGPGDPPPLGSGGREVEQDRAADEGGSNAASGAGGGGSNSDREPPESSSRCRVDPGGDLDALGLVALLALLGLGVRRRDARESTLVP